MILAIAARTFHAPSQAPWDNLFCVYDHFKKIFDPMGIILFPVISDNCAEEVCRICDGLILPGSDKNIYPEHYGHTRLPEMAHTYTVDEYARDFPLVDAFVKARKPILAICGGLQVLNVYFGGTLNQLIPNHNNIAGGQRIKIAKDSFLHTVYGTEIIEVNSYHRQGALDAAPGFRVTAAAEDGTIEALERDNIIAVQWHPEVDLDLPLFQTFLNTFF